MRARLCPLKKSFFGGIHPDDGKRYSAASPITPLPPPAQVVIPVSMHIGAPCEPVVQKGDRVKLGQLIAKTTGFVAAPIHASVSGTVAAVEPRLHPNGQKVLSIVIDNDGLDTPDESVVSHTEELNAAPHDLLELVKNGGVVGMGGATFPTHVKISSGVGKVDTMIVNAAECEPYITADQRILMEQPEQVIGGIRRLMRMLDLPKAYLAVEGNKPEAIAGLKKLLPQGSDVEVFVLRTRYPQGAEKQLIQSITGRQVPPGGLPADVQCIVFNAYTCWTVNCLAEEGLPAIQRVVTVSGPGIVNPSNFLCRVGTPVADLIEAAGGMKEEADKVLMGGPMMGNAIFDTSVPVIKGTNAVTVLVKAQNKSAENPVCIRCGRCVAACPMLLQPLYMYVNERKGNVQELERLHITDCIECGCCAYVCPGRLQLVQAFKDGKVLVKNKK